MMPRVLPRASRDLRGGLEPLAAMRPRVARRNAAQQQNDFRQHQFRHAARVGKRRVEHGNAALLGRLQIHLVGADAEASNRDQAVGCLEHGLGQLRRRADAHHVGIADRRDQLRFRQRFFAKIDIGIAVGLESLDGARMHSFEQNNLHFFFCKRCLRHEPIEWHIILMRTHFAQRRAAFRKQVVDRGPDRRSRASLV